MEGESDDNESSSSSSSSSEASIISNGGGEGSESDESSESDDDLAVDDDEPEKSSSSDSEEDEETLTLKKQELKRLLEEEKGLEELVKELKNSLVQVNKALGRKKEEMGRLSKKIFKLQGKGRTQSDESDELFKEDMEESKERGGRVIEDGTDARLVFPEEIWEMILGNVTTSKELWNCNKTCRLFRRIVRPYRVKWLFVQIFPHLYKHFTGSEIMGCRLVCNGWNAGVDRFFEAHKSLQPHDDRNSNPTHPAFVTPMREKDLWKPKDILEPHCSPFRDWVQLWNAGDTEFKLVLHVPRNPFIDRAVTIIDKETWMAGLQVEEREMLRWRRIYKFLDTYGKYIWYLTVFLSRPNPSPSARDIILRFFSVDVFQLVPNMRLLRICEFMPEPSREDEGTISDSSLLPPAPQLETLVVDSLFYDNEPILLSSLLNQYHLQLRRLHVMASSWTNVFQLEWPNLVELHVEELTTMEHFNNLLQMRIPQLKKLGLSLSGVYDWSFDKVLEVLDKLACSGPLNTLRLAGGFDMKFVAKLKSNRYAPSTLKTLEIEHSFVSYISCHTFLLRFPFLENLNVFWRRKSEDLPRFPECRSEIRFWTEYAYEYYIDRHAREQEFVEVNKYVYGKGMYNSNIWELIPNLKVFTVQWDVYTREGYEQHRKCYPGGLRRSGSNSAT